MNDVKNMTIGESVGKTIGNFDILESVGGGKVRAKCNLCGNENYTTRFYSIKSGHAKSCGCVKPAKLNVNDHIGKKYNKLTILGPSTERDKDNRPLVTAKCDCGNIKNLRLSEITNEKVKSCGCGHNSTNSLGPKDVIGTTIGNFDILEAVGGGRVKVKCNLCGNKEYVTSLYKIRSGHTKSCGCKKRIVSGKPYIGNTYNWLTIIDAKDERDENRNLLVTAKCKCGNVRDIPLSWILRGKTKSCGCMARSKDGYAGGIHKSTYDVWRQMLKRCMQSGKHVTDDPRISFVNKDVPHVRYNDYGARGITVDPKWYDVKKFVDWYEANIKDGETMDRIDNDKGYYSDNLRSATSSMQNMNQRVRKDNTLGYKGITYTDSSYRWAIKLNNKTYQREGFTTPELALVARNLYIVENKLPHDIQSCSSCKTILEYDNRINQYVLAVIKDGLKHITIFKKEELDNYKKVLDGMNKMEIGSEKE